ncbi:PQQ-binding-like beta-propeller repeat protein [Kitasatospora cinereorecta]|uniref:PQQ-binding-like beta-propeller repeat protein n=1 Tax=Kitasatospora cinereorecta TaxID=285560 RepID=A0ABW0VMB4_9ACTN
MAQEPSTTSGQGYPDEGYDYQQPWYPQQQPQQPQPTADQWNGGYAQPYGGQWDQSQQQVPAQPQNPSEGYYGQDAYGYQAAATGYPAAGYGTDYAAADHTATGYPTTGQDPFGQQPTDPYAAGYAQPYDPAVPVDPQQLYAPAGTTDQTWSGYVQPEALAMPPMPPTAPAAAPVDAAPTDALTVGFPRIAENGGDAGDAGDEDDEPGTEDGPGAKPSLVDRARAAAEAVISADHGPSRRALLVRAGAGVAALAVLVTAGVLATGEDDKPTAATTDGVPTQNIAVAHDKSWTATPAAAPAAGGDDTLTGSWLLADAVVRADASGVHAYALADGKPTWTLAPPADGAVPCGLSPTVNAAGLGAAVFRPAADPKSPCTLVAAVDTKAGKATWNKALSDAKDSYTAHVSVTDDKVIAVGDDKAAAWAAADGKDLWQYAGQGKYCSLSGGGSGNTVVLHSSCADSAPVDQAVALNAADGKVTWWRGLNNQPKTVTVLSAEPAVVLTTGAQPADDRVFAWGATGDPAAEIPVAVDGGRLEAGHGTFDAVPAVWFHEHLMFATVTSAEGATTAVTAYDLTTGKAQWRTAVAEKAKSRAAGLDGGGLLLAVDERVDQPAHISRFALTGGQETRGGAFQRGTGSLLTSGRLLTGGGKVIALPEHSSNFGTATAFASKG